MNTSENELMANSNTEFENKNQLGAGAGGGAGEWRVIACADAAGFIDWRAARVELIASPRTGRGDIGAGGGRGSIGRKGKRQSSKGGASVVGDERARLSFAWSGADGWQARWRAGDSGAQGDSLLLSRYAGKGSIASLLAAGVSVGAGAGSLLGELQAQLDLKICGDTAHKLAARMLRDGKQASAATIAAAAADAAARLAIIRARHPAWIFGVRLAAWKLVSRSVADDGLGKGIQYFSPDVLGDLRAQALPLPALLGDDSRGDMASRLLFERARAKRPALLARRIASLDGATSHAKRKLAIQKVAQVARLVMSGASLTDAAQASGFSAGGKMSAGDMASRAALRIVGDDGCKLARGEFARKFRFRKMGFPAVWTAADGELKSFAPRAAIPAQDCVCVHRQHEDKPQAAPRAQVGAWLVRDILTARDVARFPWQAARRYEFKTWQPARRQWSFDCAQADKSIRAARAAALRSFRKLELIGAGKGSVAAMMTGATHEFSGARRRVASGVNVGVRADKQAASRRAQVAARVAAALAFDCVRVFPDWQTWTMRGAGEVVAKGMPQAAAARPLVLPSIGARAGRLIARRFIADTSGAPMIGGGGTLQSVWQGAQVVGVRFNQE